MKMELPVPLVNYIIKVNIKKCQLTNKKTEDFRKKWFEISVPSFGFIFTEPTVSGLLDKQKLANFGILKSPLCGKLARGLSVEKDGKIISPADVRRPDENGRKVSILGDCSDSRVAVGPCYQSNLILHESTLENDMVKIAVDHGHSTPKWVFSSKLNFFCSILLF